MKQLFVAAALSAALVAPAFVVAESLQRQIPRSFRRFPVFDQFADAHVDMEGELGVDVSTRFEAEQPSEARPSRHGVIT